MELSKMLVELSKMFAELLKILTDINKSIRMGSKMFPKC